MKRLGAVLAVCALLFPALPSRGADVSVNLFYENLSGGNWYEVSDYGYVWQPDVAGDPNWRPYTDGYWAYTDQGWTWVSYEDFGWATYHYGRWARLDDYGWMWMPGTEWAPAWVSWRTGGDYVGWAPLPPADGDDLVFDSRPITGQVDLEFGIGPAYYNFVDLRYIGEPVLRDRIVDYNQNVTIVRNTVNVTNITYNKTTVYNYGPDFASVSRYSVRPIQRLKIQRQTNDPLQAVKNGSVTKVQGNTLLVAAPQKLQKPAGKQVVPPQVKGKIEQPKVERGWSNIDAQEKAQLEQRYKTQSAKDVPKPNIQPKSDNATAKTNAKQPAAAASPLQRSGKGKRRIPADQASSAEGGNQAGNAEGARGKASKRGENATPLRAPGSVIGNDRDEEKSSSEDANSNAPKVRETGTNRGEGQRIQPLPEEVQQGRHEMQNAPAAHAQPPRAGPGARQPREQIQGNVPQQQGERGLDRRRGKGKKVEGEATPPPQ